MGFRIRAPLSPPSYFRQIYQAARAIPHHARNERREILYLELAALAAADKEEKKGNNRFNY
jgi:hypothetical protein